MLFCVSVFIIMCNSNVIFVQYRVMHEYALTDHKVCGKTYTHLQANLFFIPSAPLPRPSSFFNLCLPIFIGVTSHTFSLHLYDSPTNTMNINCIFVRKIVYFCRCYIIYLYVYMYVLLSVRNMYFKDDLFK